VARYLMVIGAALAAFGTAAPVLAQSVDSDVRCLLAANVWARQAKDPARKQVAAIASMFYLGRLDARIPKEQLQAAMLTQAKAMPASSLGPTMNDCAKYLLTRYPIGGAQPGQAPAPPKRK